MKAIDRRTFLPVMLAVLLLLAAGGCFRPVPVTPSTLVEDGSLPFGLDEGYNAMGRSSGHMDDLRGEFHREWHFEISRLDETAIDPQEVADTLESWIGQSVRISRRQVAGEDAGEVSAVLHYQTPETSGTAEYTVRSIEDGVGVELDLEVTEEGRSAK
jgi:hypothetical protein